MMRLLGVLIVLLILVGGVGYYRGWFQAQTTSTNGQPTLSVTVDKDKIDQDKDKAKEEVHDLENRK